MFSQFERQLDQLEACIPRWSLAEDSQLCTLFENISQTVCEKSEELESRLRNAQTAAVKIGIDVETVHAKIDLIASRNFVEQKIADDDCPVRPSTSATPCSTMKTVAERQEETINSIRNAIKDALVTLQSDPAPDIELPPLIGSAEFFCQVQKVQRSSEPVSNIGTSMFAPSPPPQPPIAPVISQDPTGLFCSDSEDEKPLKKQSVQKFEPKLNLPQPPKSGLFDSDSENEGQDIFAQAETKAQNPGPPAPKPVEPLDFKTKLAETLRSSVASKTTEIVAKISPNSDIAKPSISQHTALFHSDSEDDLRDIFVQAEKKAVKPPISADFKPNLTNKSDSVAEKQEAKSNLDKKVAPIGLFDSDSGDDIEDIFAQARKKKSQPAATPSSVHPIDFKAKLAETLKESARRSEEKVSSTENEPVATASKSSVDLYAGLKDSISVPPAPAPRSKLTQDAPVVVPKPKLQNSLLDSDSDDDTTVNIKPIDFKAKLADVLKTAPTAVVKNKAKAKKQTSLFDSDSDENNDDSSLFAQSGKSKRPEPKLVAESITAKLEKQQINPKTFETMPNLPYPVKPATIKLPVPPATSQPKQIVKSIFESDSEAEDLFSSITKKTVRQSAPPKIQPQLQKSESESKPQPGISNIKPSEQKADVQVTKPAVPASTWKSAAKTLFADSSSDEELFKQTNLPAPPIKPVLQSATTETRPVPLLATPKTKPPVSSELKQDSEADKSPDLPKLEAFITVEHTSPVTVLTTQDLSQSASSQPLIFETDATPTQASPNIFPPPPTEAQSKSAFEPDRPPDFETPLDCTLEPELGCEKTTAELAHKQELVEAPDFELPPEFEDMSKPAGKLRTADFASKLSAVLAKPPPPGGVRLFPPPPSSSIKDISPTVSATPSAKESQSTPSEHKLFDDTPTLLGSVTKSRQRGPARRPPSRSHIARRAEGANNVPTRPVSVPDLAPLDPPLVVKREASPKARMAMSMVLPSTPKTITAVSKSPPEDKKPPIERKSSGSSMASITRVSQSPPLMRKGSTGSRISITSQTLTSDTAQAKKKTLFESESSDDEFFKKKTTITIKPAPTKAKAAVTTSSVTTTTKPPAPSTIKSKSLFDDSDDDLDLFRKK